MRFRSTPHDMLVEQICKSWEGVRYRLNGCSKQGIDCLHFAATVIDTLYGVKRAKSLASLPPDACAHNRKGVLAAGRALFSAYPSFKRQPLDSALEAGDLVMFGPDREDSAVQHLTVAGNSVLWQATASGVLNMPLSAPFGLKLVCVYRADDKELWSC